MSGDRTFWTDQRIAVLRVYWSEGTLASVIGDILGCSRGAVLGKLSRLGLLGKVRKKDWRFRCGEGQRRRHASQHVS